jgi:hypothetical protein
MNEPERDPLEQLLVERPMTDDGFTDRVMSRLPPRRPPLPRVLVLGGAATLGTVLAALSPGATRIAAMVSEVLSSRAALTTHTTTAIVLAAIAVVLVGTGAQIATNE